MTLLILGSILFILSHLIAVFGYRARIEAIGGHHAYMGLVTIVSIISLILANIKLIIETIVTSPI